MFLVFSLKERPRGGVYEQCDVIPGITEEEESHSPAKKGKTKELVGLNRNAGRFVYVVVKLSSGCCCLTFF